MKALIVKSPGGPLLLEDIQIPEPGAGEVLVRIEAAPVNPSDLRAIKQGKGGDFIPFVPGLEGAGIVVKAGKGLLPRLLLNRRVACSPKKDGNGTWAEYMLTDAAHCFPLGKKISAEQGAMALINPLTAIGFIDIAKEGGHKAIINNAAASALGRMLELLCGRNGITLINIVRSNERAEQLRKLGSAYVLDSSDPGFGGNLSSLARKLNATLLFDSACGDGFRTLAESMPDGSTIVLYGNLSKTDYVMVNPRALLSRNLTITGFFLGSRTARNGMLKNIKNLILVRKLMGSGMTIKVRGQYSLAGAASAIDTYLSDMSEGKVLLRP
ncbi:MAG TPA: zinc-binding dehydrogenase [Bacteroidales bacterium]|nr:zinc-binding dehydrogenase [Bacteroidales bacterium]